MLLRAEKNIKTRITQVGCTYICLPLLYIEYRHSFENHVCLPGHNYIKFRLFEHRTMSYNAQDDSYFKIVPLKSRSN